MILGETSVSYVALIGCLFAASTFTGYDTAAHVAEETTVSHMSTPYGMVFSVINCYILGKDYRRYLFGKE